MHHHRHHTLIVREDSMDDRYEQYFQEMPCYMSIHDRDVSIIDASRRFRTDFGDRIGDFCYRAYKQREEVCEDCPVEMTFADGKGHSSEQLLLTRHGKQRHVMVHTTPFSDEHGNVVSVMEMLTNISGVKKLQQLLERSQEHFARLFEEVPCYISVQGQDLKIQDANRQFRETFGPAVGNYCYEVYKHRDEPCLVCVVQQTLEDGKCRNSEEVVTSAEGEKINVLATTAPIFGADGKPEAVIEMSADITQIRQLQSQLTSIGLLVGSISHGIKGMLTGLDGGIYLVSSGFEQDDRGRIQKGWDMVQRNVERIRTMVMDILYYAKDRDLSLVDIDPVEVFSDVESGLMKKASDINTELDIQVAPDAGKFAGDAMAVRAMLMNIVENSLDACRADRHKDRHLVRVDVHREPPWMIFEVEDNGIGMDRETREKVFSLFFTSKGIKGTGLGLFIANKIIDKHGGRIEVDSEPQRGTRFLVRFPLEARPSVPPIEIPATQAE
jgi:PAS domain S-box-containing protein